MSEDGAGALRKSPLRTALQVDKLASRAGCGFFYEHSEPASISPSQAPARGEGTTQCQAATRGPHLPALPPGQRLRACCCCWGGPILIPWAGKGLAEGS